MLNIKIVYLLHFIYLTRLPRGWVFGADKSTWDVFIALKANMGLPTKTGLGVEIQPKIRPKAY